MIYNLAFFDVLFQLRQILNSFDMLKQVLMFSEQFRIECIQREQKIGNPEVNECDFVSNVESTLMSTKDLRVPFEILLSNWLSNGFIVFINLISILHLNLGVEPWSQFSVESLLKIEKFINLGFLPFVMTGKL